MLSCLLMLEALGICYVPNFQRVGLMLFAAGMLALYAGTLRRKIKGLATNENELMPFWFGELLLFWQVRRYDFGEEGKLWLWIGSLSLLLALPMLIVESRISPREAGNNPLWMRAIAIVFVVVISCFSWIYATNVAFDTSEGTAATGVITRKWTSSRMKVRTSYYLEVSKTLLNETNTFSVSRNDYNRYDEQTVVTVTEYAGFWGAPYYDVTLPKTQGEN